MEIIDQKILHDSVRWPLPPKYVGTRQVSYIAPSNLLIYCASQQIPITTSGKNNNVINVGTFFNNTNGQRTLCTVVSHEFVDGVGTITFDKDVTEITGTGSNYCILSVYITEVRLPSTLTSTNCNYAIFGCPNMIRIVIPSSVTTIAQGIMNTYSGNPTALKELYIESENLVFLGNYSILYGANNLEKVVIRSKNLITPNYSYGSSAFQNGFTNAPNYKIYVPDDLVNTYKTAYGWTSYADHIVPLSTLQ